MLPRPRTPLFATGLLALCALPASARAQADDGYAMRPGDKVTISVFTAGGEQVGVVSGERILDRDGDIYLPYVGTVHAAGQDQTSLRELLARRYETFYSQPVINVKVELRINITGSVGRPGQYYVDPTATLIDAISAAGGAAAEFATSGNQGMLADPSKVRLVRDGVTTIFSVRPDEITEETIRLRIKSGDWIHVPTRPRSRVRDEITFWGSVLSITSSFISLIILINR
ncbi:MAG TPA: polysaccharide biosynthesis/export family protein [Longimicrobiales bacterium]|nr:polysaccharide biosynthesis/export family protein [Longimicrobiales bacterium]